MIAESLDIVIKTTLSTGRDVAPIIFLLLFFQYVVLRKPIANLRKTIEGFIYVVAGLALFLIGLEKALFPLGEIMATQVLHLNMFQVVPDTLIGVQVRGIAGQTHQMNTLSAPVSQKVFDRLSAMSGQPIPDDEQLARDVP